MTRKPAQRMRERKAELGLTLADLSRRSRLAVPTIEGYLSDRYQPSFRGMIGMAQALECSADYLAGFSDTPDIPVERSGREQLEDAAAMIESFARRRVDELAAQGHLTAAGSILTALGTLRGALGIGQ